MRFIYKVPDRQSSSVKSLIVPTIMSAQDSLFSIPNANIHDLPVVTLHFEDEQHRGAALAVACPHSPTSSLRGVFVRSRPTSMLAPDGSELQGGLAAADLAQFGMTAGAARVPVIHAAPPARTAQPKHAQEEREDDDDDAPARGPAQEPGAVPAVPPSAPIAAAPAPDAPGTRRRRTWPTMGRLRGRVSGIFQRKTQAPAAPPGSPATPTDAGAASGPRASARSLGLRAHAGSTTNLLFRSSKSTAKTGHGPVEDPARARTRRVRRSRSFSGFTSMAQRALSSIPDSEQGLDEVGREAYDTMRGLSPFWVYDHDSEGADDEEAGEAYAYVAAVLLEHGVEA
ncbi:hypothetical protein GGX14DRAFT_542183 [Mycena pura]|uniref:Uncharacterized protein n=1 Tax=Mycena pura TaxID=153505 RepID=A0AAD6VJ02_9AGAR|nr:hypothetical protein GGX14DRAFT_542183 [Mycena pura]